MFEAIVVAALVLLVVAMIVCVAINGVHRAVNLEAKNDYEYGYVYVPEYRGGDSFFALDQQSEDEADEVITIPMEHYYGARQGNTIA